MVETRQQRRFKERNEPNWVPMGPDEPSIDQKALRLAGSGVLTVGAAVLGNVMPSMGAGGLWFFFACMILAGALFAWGHWGWKTWPILLVTIIVAGGLGFKGYRAVTKAGEVVKYQICASPRRDNATGLITSFEMDIELINDNDTEKWVNVGDNPYLSFNGTESKREFTNTSFTMKKKSDYVIPLGVALTPPLDAAGKLLWAQYRYSFTYGQDREDAKRPLVVSGKWWIQYDRTGKWRDGPHPMPDAESSADLIGYCNLMENRSAQRS